MEATGRLARRPLLVAGGGGALGAAVLEALLGARAFVPITVLVTQDFHASVPGLVPLRVESFAAPPAARADLGIVVFDRERRANGRDAAFWRPSPDALPALAAWLRAAGVRDLIVVMPHDAGRLPQALQQGLANLDEQAVAALGFEHLVILRSARAPGADGASRGLQRLADAVLAQLRLMTPQRLLPVRTAKLAALVAALAARLSAAPPGARVMPADWIWLAAQVEDVGMLAQRWLDGLGPPELAAARMRL